MQWCHNNGYFNSLVSIGKTYCGEPVWYPGMETGMYSFGVSKSIGKRFTKEARAAGFVIESEFE